MVRVLLALAPARVSFIDFHTASRFTLGSLGVGLSLAVTRRTQ